MRQFLRSFIHSPEVKRGAAHFVVGVVVGLVSAIVHRAAK